MQLTTLADRNEELRKIQVRASLFDLLHVTIGHFVTRSWSEV